MAVLRDNPYPAFNFRVSFGPDPATRLAGFCEVSGLSADVAVVEHRAGNERSLEARKLPGLVRYGDVVLRRGVIGSTDLWQWFQSVRDGNAERRDVLVELLSEDRASVVMVWKLRGCFPIKYTGPTLRAESSAVAIEELVLSAERIDVE